MLKQHVLLSFDTTVATFVNTIFIMENKMTINIFEIVGDETIERSAHSSLQIRQEPRKNSLYVEWRTKLFTLLFNVRHHSLVF